MLKQFFITIFLLNNITAYTTSTPAIHFVTSPLTYTQLLLMQKLYQHKLDSINREIQSQTKHINDLQKEAGTLTARIANINTRIARKEQCKKPKSNL